MESMDIILCCRILFPKKFVTFMHNNRKIELHDEKPFTSPQTPSEKIIFSDLPLDLPGDDVIKYNNLFQILLLDRMPS